MFDFFEIEARANAETAQDSDGTFDKYRRLLGEIMGPPADSAEEEFLFYAPIWASFVQPPQRDELLCELLAEQGIVDEDGFLSDLLQQYIAEYFWYMLCMGDLPLPWDEESGFGSEEPDCGE